MPTITTNDGVEIFYKDWGSGRPIVFSHGWPLSSDDWDAQMLFFLNHGFRVIAHDRRGHGRSAQVADGHDMDHYADDLAALTSHLDLKKAVHVGHSTGGGEVVHYIARHGDSRVAKAAILSAAADGADTRQFGWPTKICLRRSSGAARCEPHAILSRPRGGSLLRLQPARREAVGGRDRELVAAGYDGRGKSALRWHRRILADRLYRGSEEDHRAGAGHAWRRRPDCALCGLGAAIGDASEERDKTYKGFPHGMPTTEAATINADLLAFIRG